MKKIIIILSVLSVIILAGCSAKTGQKSTTGTTPEGTSSTNENNQKRGTNVAETTVEITGLGANNYSTEKVIWGPGHGENHSRPKDPVSLQKQFGKLGSQFIMNDDKFICLTFDEGYENGYTPAILDTLKEKNVKAVFFVTYDFAKDNPSLIKRMIDEGHVVGNHTYRHYTMDEVSAEDAAEEIVFLDKYIKKNFGYKMKLFRFPKGEFSENTLALADSLGYKSIFWSFAYADWDAQNEINRDTALKNVTDNFHNGEIMLLHAVNSVNAEILPSIIDEAKKQGYEFTVEV